MSDLKDFMHMGLQPDAAVFCTRLAQSAAKSDQASEKSPAEARFEYDLLFNVGFKGVPVRVYRPRDPEPHEYAVSTVTNILIYLHGGGWTIGSIEGYDKVCRHLSARSGAIVISVGYRLAPEHKAPAAVEDAMTVLRWVHRMSDAKLSSFIFDDDNDTDRHWRVGIAGDSAGGNISAVVAILASQERLSLCFQGLLFPATSLKDTESRQRYANGLFISRQTMDWFFTNYVVNATRLEHRWHVAPMEASESALTHVAPALVVTAEFDPLVDEGRAYADKLRRSGVHVEYREYAGQIHVFPFLGQFITQAPLALDEICASFARMFARTTADISPKL